MSFTLLGILNAQAAGAVVGATSFDLLETTILTADTASVTFSSLDSTYGSDYKHLQLRFTARTNVAANNDNFRIRINGDSGSNYAAHRLTGNGSAVGSNGYSNEDFMRNLGVTPGATSTANVFNAAVLDILDPFSTTKNTTVRAFSGMTSSNLINLASGLHINTNSVDSILIDGLSGSFVEYSRFSLYGIKAE